MPGFDHSVLTDVGWDALTDAEAGQHIEYTHLEAGKGYVYGGDTEIYGMTNLVDKVMDFPITNFSNDGQGQITLVGVISSKNVTTGFDFREIGVRCTIDGGPSILYAVANAGDEADYIPSSAESGIVIQTIQIIIKIDRATNVTVIIQPGLDVTAQNIGPGTAGAGWFRDKQSQILWFKRFNSPKKTVDIIETADLITLDIPTIDVDLDMFVALGNPDIFPHFSTIQKALDYLTPFAIKAGKFVTIKVSAGVWHNSHTEVKHVQASQIKIIGTAGAVQTVASMQLWNSTGYHMRFNAPVGSPFTDLEVGDYFIYENFGYRAACAISGVWQVGQMAADHTWLSFITNFQGPFPPSFGGESGGILTPIKTILAMGPTHKEAIHVMLDLGLLKHVVVTADDYVAGRNGGVVCSRGTTVCENVGVYLVQGNYARGFLCITTGSMICRHCAASNCWSGFSSLISGGSMTCYDCFGNCNFEGGFYFQQGVGVTFNSAACGNRVGYSADAGSAMNVNYTMALYNGYLGISSSNGTHINVGSMPPNTYGGFATGNTYRDIACGGVSSITRGASLPFYYQSSNIAPGVLSYDGCWFKP